jgi:hypothetical protein
MSKVESGAAMRGCRGAHWQQRRRSSQLDHNVAQLETSLFALTLFTVAARTLGGQARRSKTTPAKKE